MRPTKKSAGSNHYDIISLETNYIIVCVCFHVRSQCIVVFGPWSMFAWIEFRWQNIAFFGF